MHDVAQQPVFGRRRTVTRNVDKARTPAGLILAADVLDEVYRIRRSGEPEIAMVVTASGRWIEIRMHEVDDFPTVDLADGSGAQLVEVSEYVAPGSRILRE
jgi:hypothetical protein